MRKALRWTVGCLVILGLASAPNAEAALMLAIEVNGVQACAVDNNAACAFGTQLLDIDPTPGVMSFGNTPVPVGIISLTGTSQQATVGPPNILNTSSAQVTNTGSVVAQGFFAVSATDFVPPASQAFTSGSSTWQNAAGSSIAMQWYNDPMNRQGAETATDLPGILLSFCADVISLTADSTACSDNAVPISDLAPFSMTLFTQFNLVPGGTVVNRGQGILKPLVQPPVIPEPASLVLLGSAFGAAGYVARHRARRRKPADT